MSGQHNFCFPISTLSNDRIKLVPFSASKHAVKFIELSKDHPELWAHMRLGPLKSADEFTKQFLEEVVAASDGMLAYAIIDKTRGPSTEDDEGALAGMLSYMASSAIHMCTEIAFVVVLPPFQRSHVASNAVGLMIQHALDDPKDGGLGLARLVWTTSTANMASAKVAERMGFTQEGVFRYHMRFPQGKLKSKFGNEKPLPPGTDPDDLYRDSIYFGMTWDDWRNGAKEKVQAIMDRRV